MGVARRRAGDWVGAETAYRKATEVDPDNLRRIRISASWRLEISSRPKTDEERLVIQEGERAVLTTKE